MHWRDEEKNLNLAEATRILKQNLEKVKNIFLFTKNNGSKVAILDHGHLFLFFFSRLFKWFFSNGKIILIYFEKNWELDCYFEAIINFFYDVFFLKKKSNKQKTKNKKKLCHSDIYCVILTWMFSQVQDISSTDKIPLFQIYLIVY